MAFLHPDTDPQGAGFQLLQSLIAVGSGGFTGVGLMESKQKLFLSARSAHRFYLRGYLRRTRLHRRDHHHRPLCRCLRGAACAPPSTPRMDSAELLALGVTAMVVFQSLINFAVVLGMMPTKGIPLPFVSYGGSSLLVMLLATGVLLNIAQQAAAGALGRGTEPMKLIDCRRRNGWARISRRWRLRKSGCHEERIETSCWLEHNAELK